MDKFKVLKDFANSLEDEASLCGEDAYTMSAVLFRVSDTLNQVLKNIESDLKLKEGQWDGET